ncbi:MAG: (Fe-S)-binding protein, partial [Methanomassiliicoccaceae archaeon]|nr:(Fe-S)-binding protein [Methanomassiliicoccaceae archaeon]
MKDTIKIGKMPRIQQELTACLQCGYCISVCEAHGQTPWESVTPRGKIFYLKQLNNASIVDNLLGREVELSPYFVDAMYKCTGCGNCEAVCHASIPLVEFWETMRKWIVDEGAGPMPAHKTMAQKVGEVHNPYGEPPSKRGDWWPAEVERSPTPDVIFFAGCTGAYRQQGLPQTGVRVLARAGVKINMLGTEEWCCSSPLLRTGTHLYSLECAEQVVEKSDGMGAKDMVMTCSGCYKTVSSDFGKFYAKTGQNVYHFSQYVERLIAEKKLPLNNEFKAKVTYHDPCHMGRHMGVFDAPRNVLKKIKGIELVEMTRTRESSRCCGAGGGYKSQYNDFAVNIAAERIRDAEETGAEILVTCCPFCVVNLTQGAKQINSKIKIMDLSEILLKVTAPVEKPAEEKKPEPPKERLQSTPSDAEIAEKARLAAAEKERLAAAE